MASSSVPKIVSLSKLITDQHTVRFKYNPIWVDDCIDIVLNDNGTCSLVDCGGMSVDAAFKGTYYCTEDSEGTIHFSIKDCNEYGGKELDETLYTFSLQYILYEQERFITAAHCKKVYVDDNDNDNDELDDENAYTLCKTYVKVTHTIHFSGDPFMRGGTIDEEFVKMRCQEMNREIEEFNEQNETDYKKNYTPEYFFVKNDLGAYHGGQGYLNHYSVYYVQKNPVEYVKINKN